MVTHFQQYCNLNTETKARLHSLRMVLVMLVAMTVFVGDDDKDVSEEVTILQQHTERNSRDDEQKHEA